jgi:hypothetical protein
MQHCYKEICTVTIDQPAKILHHATVSVVAHSLMRQDTNVAWFTGKAAKILSLAS